MAIRVLIPAWSFYPSQEGGPSNALYWLASGLANKGYRVRVVTTNRCIAEGVVVSNEWVRLNSFDVIYASVANRDQYLYEELNNCDVLVTSGVCTLRGVNLIIRAILLGKKIILSPRGELLDSAINHKGSFYGYLKKGMFYLMRTVYARKVLFHATSLEEEKAIHKYMGSTARVVLIPNYMILPERVINDSLSEPYLLYVGRLNHIKNIDLILSGLSRSSCFMNGNYKFKIAGDNNGEYYESLVSLTKDLGLSRKVDFLGLVIGKEKDLLYAGAKCLLLMSKSENFGNVIVEALSQGTPVIASKGTPWQQLDTKGAGWWIDANQEEISHTVDKLLALDTNHYSDMRAAAYAYSREFDIYTNIDRWVEVINS